MIMNGWLCPRCDTVNAPHVKHCDCKSPQTMPSSPPTFATAQAASLGSQFNNSEALYYKGQRVS
jgi:hypothetical protein